jgi:hypothetical protein
MKNLAIALLVVASVIEGGSVFGQDSAASTPDFSLMISQDRPNAMLPKNTEIIVVRKTNLSKEIMRESACTAFGVLYRLDVIYNGVPQKEPEGKRERRESAEAVEAGKPAICEGSNPGRALQPGESWDDTLHYHAEKPGTYEFTVEEKSFPKGGAESIVVRSNTLTIVVPPESGSESQTHN